jgi:hypothetical protein
MTFDHKAAIAAIAATMCILIGTMTLAQGIKAPHARYVAIAVPANSSAS